MIIVWAKAIDRRASLPRLIALQMRVLAETTINASYFKNYSMVKIQLNTHHDLFVQ